MRRFALAVVPLGLFASAAHAADGACQPGEHVTLWTSPAVPVAGAPLRVMAVGDDTAAVAGDLTIATGGGKAQALEAVRRGTTPASATAVVAKATAGKTRVRLVRGGRAVACVEVDVSARRSASAERPQTYWPTTRAWDGRTDAFYAAFIEALFDAPIGESFSFASLAPILRDPKRNFLYDHLALGEDAATAKSALPAEPDCADLPYYLRAYFSWKLGLPFGMRNCDRGSADGPPRCRDLTTNEAAPEPSGKGRDRAPPATPLAAFKQFLRKLANTVHSGSARTALGDDVTDAYPVALTREALRPGTVYADPYGHVLMIVKWVPQTATTGGQLLAVDGQPDNSVGRKRFWEGTFLFTSGLASAGPGFKAFRPLERDANGALTPLTNAALAKDGRFARQSREQAELDADQFYARMSKLINPRGLEPRAAYEETLAALVEQLETRVGSVDTGETFMQKEAGTVVPMPEGAKIFETVGPWEDYATPSRDMRLIIAMNVLLGLPDRIVRHPDLFVLGGRKPAEARAEVQALHDKLTRDRAIEYKRSGGTPQKLTVAELLTRKSAFEVAYNPNDCVELRWGAKEGTPELESCKRRAPTDQRARMETVRAWFREAKRPPR